MKTIRPTAQQIAAMRLAYCVAHLSHRLRRMRITAFIEVDGRRL